MRFRVGGICVRFRVGGLGVRFRVGGLGEAGSKEREGRVRRGCLPDALLTWAGLDWTLRFFLSLKRKRGQGAFLGRLGDSCNSLL